MSSAKRVKPERKKAAAAAAPVPLGKLAPRVRQHCLGWCDAFDLAAWQATCHGAADEAPLEDRWQRQYLADFERESLDTDPWIARGDEGGSESSSSSSWRDRYRRRATVERNWLNACFVQHTVPLQLQLTKTTTKAWGPLHVAGGTLYLLAGPQPSLYALSLDALGERRRAPSAAASAPRLVRQSCRPDLDEQDDEIRRRFDWQPTRVWLAGNSVHTLATGAALELPTELDGRPVDYTRLTDGGETLVGTTEGADGRVRLHLVDAATGHERTDTRHAAIDCSGLGPGLQLRRRNDEYLVDRGSQTLLMETEGGALLCWDLSTGALRWRLAAPVAAGASGCYMAYGIDGARGLVLTLEDYDHSPYSNVHRLRSLATGAELPGWETDDHLLRRCQLRDGRIVRRDHNDLWLWFLWDRRHWSAGPIPPPAVHALQNLSKKTPLAIDWRYLIHLDLAKNRLIVRDYRACAR